MGVRNFLSLYCHTLVSIEKVSHALHPPPQMSTLRWGQGQKHMCILRPLPIHSFLRWSRPQQGECSVMYKEMRFLTAVELEFYDDKYLWTEITTHLGYLLVNLCLLSFLTSLLTIAPFFSLTTFLFFFPV